MEYRGINMYNNCKITLQIWVMNTDSIKQFSIYFKSIWKDIFIN